MNKETTIREEFQKEVFNIIYKPYNEAHYEEDKGIDITIAMVMMALDKQDNSYMLSTNGNLFDMSNNQLNGICKWQLSDGMTKWRNSHKHQSIETIQALLNLIKNDEK